MNRGCHSLSPVNVSDFNFTLNEAFVRLTRQSVSLVFGDHEVESPVERLRLGVSIQEPLSALDFGDIEPEMLALDFWRWPSEIPPRGLLMLLGVYDLNIVKRAILLPVGCAFNADPVAWAQRQAVNDTARG